MRTECIVKESAAPNSASPFLYIIPTKYQQPEIAKPIDRKFTIRSGWQNEFEIAL
ncbi:MAG: hypothetical protein ABL876_05430 [Chitinophagaceae bacterium]